MFPKASVDQLNKFSENTMVENLGIKFTKIEDDQITATMPVDHRTVQPMRLLHGGATVSLAETIGTHSAVGTEIGASHIKSGREGTIVTAVCKPIHIGKTSHVWEIKVTNDQNQLVSLVRFTTRIIERRN
jgi:1,4-dihydroxy-2-naphthoyl-CoA hydrolase